MIHQSKMKNVSLDGVFLNPPPMLVVSLRLDHCYSPRPKSLLLPLAMTALEVVKGAAPGAAKALVLALAKALVLASAHLRAQMTVLTVAKVHVDKAAQAPVVGSIKNKRN